MLLPLEYYFQEQPLLPLEFDSFLNEGYFRTGSYFTKTRVLFFNNEHLNTLNIRMNLQQQIFKKRHQKLLQKNNQLFTYTIQPLQISQAKETLYKQHKKRFKGNSSTTLEQYLYDHKHLNIFNTYEIEIYENNKLIGYSFFDIGQKSMASILGIFDQNYAKYSIGIYTMLLEIEYGKQQKFHYYYPGYVADIPSQFNYKLELGNYDYYDWFEENWQPFQNSKNAQMVNALFIEKQTELSNWLTNANMPFKKVINPFYYYAGMYPDSDCVNSIDFFLIENYTQKDVYFLAEFNPKLMQYLISAFAFHQPENEEELTPNNILDKNKLKRIPLYIKPYILIQDANEININYQILSNCF